MKLNKLTLGWIHVPCSRNRLWINQDKSVTEGEWMKWMNSMNAGLNLMFISWAQVLNSDIIEHCLREIRSEAASYSEVQLYSIISFAHKSISFTFALGQCYTPIQQLQARLFTWCATKALVWNNTKACAAQVTLGMSDLSLTFPHRKVTYSILVLCALCRNKKWARLNLFQISDLCNMWEKLILGIGIAIAHFIF